MAEDEPTKLPSSLPLVVSVALISAAILVWRLPLESSRPSPPSGLQPVVLDANEVDAALWQDPFEVALNHEKEFHRVTKDEALKMLRSCPSDHCVNLLGPQFRAVAARPNRRSPAVHILMLMVRDEWSAEDHERRLRNRYAVLAALRASGMGPAQPKHIQYFKLPPAEWPSSPQPLAFPFEWFTRETLYAADPQRDERPERVLVLWLPQSAFEAQPLEKIDRLLRMVARYLPEGSLSTEPQEKRRFVRADLIGPSFSTVLKTMLDEIDNFKNPRDVAALPGRLPWGEGKAWLWIYSPWATASPALLVRDPNAVADCTSAARLLEVIPKRFEQAGIRFIPMIGTDDMLANCIIEELERRGVRVISRSDGDQIVLISEWDTFYGKAFPLTFAAMMRALGSGRPVADRPHELDWNAYAKGLAASLQKPDLPRNLHLYAYLAGIDGRLPDVPGRETKTPSGPAGAISKWTYSDNLELPMGQGQLDYARRLAQRLHDEFGRLGGPRLKAIGVVGSDVYDKLILLHALREEFGNTLLFTVDLDARLLDHEQLKWTRNVLVASNYGLQLNPVYYAETNPRMSKLGNGRSSPFPPFRENYQAALFLACRAALGLRQSNDPNQRYRLRDPQNDALTSLLTHPRMFEVGRRGAVDLDLSADPDGLHPPRAPWTSQRGPILPLAVILVCLGLVIPLWIPLARGLCGVAPWACRDASGAYDPARHRIFRKAVFVALALFSGLVIYNHYASHGERFSLSNGISAWPGLAIWLIAVLVGIHFVKQASRIIQESNADLAAGTSGFGLGALPDTPSFVEHVEAIKAKVRSFGGSLLPWAHPWQALTGAWAASKRLWVQAFRKQADDPPADQSQPVYVHDLWNDYITSGHCHLRIVRTVVTSVLFFLAILVVMSLYGIAPVPGRGFWSFCLYGSFGLLVVLLLLFLLFFAIDGIRLCLRLINPLIAHKTIWPRNEPQDPSGALVDPWSDREGWMDVRFIARLTEAQGKLLYLPAIVLLLIIAGRFWYFDNWGYPLQVLLVYAAIALWLGFSAVGLMSAAKRARAAALERLQETLRQAEDEARAERVKAMMVPQGRRTASSTKGDKTLPQVRAEARAERIKAMIEDIRSIKKGAFRPLAENPVVHFLLIPSGGVGLLTLLAYLLPT